MFGPAASNEFSTVWVVVGIAILIIVLVIVAVLGRFINLYIRAMVSGARVSFFELIGMSLRKVPSVVIVNSRIQATRTGLAISQPEMESHVLAGGDVERVIRAMIAANKANINLSWKTATAIDLAGRDILEAVQTSVNPKVIDVPSAAMGRSSINGVAKDGIQLKVKARVTVRTNIKSLVGGATEETIIARVGEGIVSAIGTAINYKHVLENPDNISKAVLAKGLDANTAFEILSINIADIDVGENLGAKLLADRAEADKRRFQAEAEHAPRHGRRPRAGEHRQAGREPRHGRAGRGRCSQGDCRGLPLRPPRRHGLLPHQEYPGRHHDARSCCEAVNA